MVLPEPVFTGLMFPSFLVFRTYPTLHLLRLFGSNVCWSLKVEHGLSSFFFIFFFVFHLGMRRSVKYLSACQFLDRGFTYGQEFINWFTDWP